MRRPWEGNIIELIILPETDHQRYVRYHRLVAAKVPLSFSRCVLFQEDSRMEKPTLSNEFH